jgi:hypothetical protein
MKFTRKRLALFGGVVAVAAAIAVPAAIAAVYPGSLGPGDTTQTDRLFRDGIPSNCFNGKANPGLAGVGGVRSRDTRSFWNPTAKPQCVLVRLTHNCGGADVNRVNAFSQANSTFVAADPSLNYLGDAGQSGGGGPFPPQAFSFVVAPFQTFDVTVATVDIDLLNCASYLLTVQVGNPGLKGGPAAAAKWSMAVDHR